MNGNKKIIILSLVLLVAVFAVLSACKGEVNGEETVVVTDENGVPVTDANGEQVTAVLDTVIVEVTNINGEKVYDENGNVKTSVVYTPREIGVPVTDENGNPVTNANGEILTTMISYPAPTTSGPDMTAIPMTDANGKTVTDANGNSMTYTVAYSTNPATPGNNTANWGSTFGGSGNDTFVDTAATSDGGFVALVQSNSTDGSMSALAGDSATPIPVLIKYNRNGKIAWQKAISSDKGIVATGLAVDSEGNIAVSGYTKSGNLGFTNAGDYDAVLFKYNKKGELQWTQSFGGNRTDGFEAVAAGPDGSFTVVGYSASSDGTGTPLGFTSARGASIVVRYASDGTLVFMQSVGSTGDSLKNLVVDGDGNIYAVGNFSARDQYKLFTSFGRADAGVVKLSSSGEILWTRQYGGSGIENFPAIALAPDGGCVIAGSSKSKDQSLSGLSNHGGYDAVLVKYKSDGKLDWQRNFSGYFDDGFTDVAATADGYAAVGYSNSVNRDLQAVGNRGGTDAIVVQFTAAGRVDSVQGYGGSRDDRFEALCLTNAGEIIACGSTLSTDGDLVGSAAKSDGTATVGMIARFT